MPHYAVRITHSYEECKRVVALWALKSQKMAVYEHVGGKTDKVHIHLALFGTSVDKKQLRNIAMNANLPVKGNENCSFKEWDTDESYLSYMTKGTIEPAFLLNYTTEDAIVWRVKWVPPKDHVKETVWSKFYKEFAPTCDVPKLDMEAWFKSDSADPPKDNRYQFVLNAAHKFVRSKFPSWFPGEHNYVKCCVINHCRYNGISIPDKARIE